MLRVLVKPLLISAALATIALCFPTRAQAPQQLRNHLQTRIRAGDMTVEKDIAPVFERIKSNSNERELSALIRALASAAESDSGAPAAVREHLRNELPAVILNFVKGPYSANERDTVVMLLRSIDAPEADLKAGIALAEAEAARGVPHFGNSARLLRGKLGRLATAPENAAQASTPQPASQAARKSRDEPQREPDTSDFDDKFHEQMKLAQRAMSAKRYQDVLNLFAPLEKEMTRTDPKHRLISEWAWVLDFKRFARYEIEGVSGALATCRQTMQVLEGAGDWAYLSEHNIVRAARRACRNLLASDTIENTTNMQGIEKAVEQIDACFEDISPIEDVAQLDPFYVTRARIYLKAHQATGKYEEALFKTLATAELRNVDLSEDEDLKKLGLQKVLRSPAYIAYRKKNKA